MSKILKLSVVWLLSTGINVSLAAQSTDGAIVKPGKLKEEALAMTTAVSSADLKSMQASEKFLLIDVRTEREYLAGHLGGAHWIPRGKLEFAIQDLSVDAQQKMVIYCRSGARAALASRTLTEMGYKNVHNLTGGFKAWVEGGDTVFNSHGEIKVVNYGKTEIPGDIPNK